MGNFIDKTFTVMADILLKVLPASKQEKQAFSYYRAGMAAQSNGKYAEALELDSNLPQALNNIAVIYHSSGLNTLTMVNEEIDDIQQAEYRALATEFFDKAGEYWRQALKLAPDNYPGARNWLKVSGRLFEEN